MATYESPWDVYSSVITGTGLTLHSPWDASFVTAQPFDPFIESVVADPVYAGYWYAEDLAEATLSAGNPIALDQVGDFKEDMLRQAGTLTIASNGGGGFSKAVAPDSTGYMQSAVPGVSSGLESFIMVLYLDFSSSPSYQLFGSATGGSNTDELVVDGTNVIYRNRDSLVVDTQVAHGSVSGWYAISVACEKAGWVGNEIDMWLTRLTGSFTHGNVGTDNTASSAGGGGWAGNRGMYIYGSTSKTNIGSGRVSCVSTFSNTLTALEMATHVELLVAS